MTSPTNLLSPAWATVRDQLRDRRQAHAARKSLARELAAYTSQSDLNDLDAILVRYSDTDTAVIRGILADHRG
jgi:hypothetical protein